DLLDESDRQRLLAEGNGEKPVAISAVTGEGIDALAAIIEERLSGALEPVTVTLQPNQLGLMNWLYGNGEVVARNDNEDGSVSISMRVTAAAREEMESRLRGNNKG